MSQTCTYKAIQWLSDSSLYCSTSSHTIFMFRLSASTKSLPAFMHLTASILASYSHVGGTEGCDGHASPALAISQTQMTVLPLCNKHRA